MSDNNDNDNTNNGNKNMNFNILLGDTAELMTEIKESSDYQTVLGSDRRDGWGLYRTKHGFYWDIDDSKVKQKLGNQFMIIPSEIKIYICFHFRQKEPIAYIQNLFQTIESDLVKHKKQYVFVGLDFNDHKFQRNIKKELIKWCLDLVTKHGTDYCQYYDFLDLDVEW